MKQTFTHSQYRRDIDGLRAVAVLVVVASHAGLLDGGFIGVDIFFVISGFLISGIIFRELDLDRFSICDFYARRVKRIFPSLAIVLTVVPALGWLILLPDAYQQLGKETWEGAGFMLNLGLDWNFGSDHFSDGSILSMAHLWSLGVEEQFYLAWPIFLLLTWRFQKWQFSLIAIVTLLSFVANITETSKGPWVAYGLPWARLWELSAGGALAYINSNGEGGTKWLDAARALTPSLLRGLFGPHARGLIGAGLLIASCVVFQHAENFPGYPAVAPTVGALLVISAGHNSFVNTHLLSTSPLVFIGLISYPLYLWHFPLLQIAWIVQRHLTLEGGAAAVAASLIFSYLSYKYVELPLRSQANTAVKVWSLCATMLVCGTVGYAMSAKVIQGRSLPADARRLFLATTEDWLPGTQSTYWTQMPKQFPILGSGQRRVLYIGDGDMEQYYPRIAKVLIDHPRNAHAATFAVREGCAPGAIEISETTETDRNGCNALLAKAIAYAKEPMVDTVVIGACWPFYFTRVNELNAGADRALGSLQHTIEELVKAKKRVYVVLSSPVGGEFDPRQMIRRTVVPPGFRPALYVPKRIDVMKAVDPIESKLLEVARLTGAHVIDPKLVLCSDITCPALSAAGDAIYHDAFHLRPSYVLQHASFMDPTILDVDLVAISDQIHH